MTKCIHHRRSRGQTIEVYDSRQLRPHRDPQYKEIECINQSSYDGYNSDEPSTSARSGGTATSSAKQTDQQSNMKSKKSLLKKQEDKHRDKNKNKTKKTKVHISKKNRNTYLTKNPK